MKAEQHHPHHVIWRQLDMIQSVLVMITDFFKCYMNRNPISSWIRPSKPQPCSCTKLKERVLCMKYARYSFSTNTKNSEFPSFGSSNGHVATVQSALSYHACVPRSSRSNVLTRDATPTLSPLWAAFTHFTQTVTQFEVSLHHSSTPYSFTAIALALRIDWVTRDTLLPSAGPGSSF